MFVFYKLTGFVFLVAKHEHVKFCLRSRVSFGHRIVVGKFLANGFKTWLEPLLGINMPIVVYSSHDFLNFISVITAKIPTDTSWTLDIVDFLPYAFAFGDLFWIRAY